MAKQDRSEQTIFAFAIMGERRSFAHQTGREAKGYCGCRFLQRRVKKREALLPLFQATSVAILPSRNHEADTVALRLAAALDKKKTFEYYKFNSTSRNKYAGKSLEALKTQAFSASKAPINTCSATKSGVPT